MYVADSSNHCIPKVNAAGSVSTLAGGAQEDPKRSGIEAEYFFVHGYCQDTRFNFPLGLTLVLKGSLMVTNKGNHALRKVSSEGQITTVLGSLHKDWGFANGQVAHACCCNPSGVEINGNGVIILADSNNNHIRMIPGGQVTTIAGDGEREPKIDGPEATARLLRPSQLVLHKKGRLLILDCHPECFRVLQTYLNMDLARILLIGLLIRRV